MTTRAVLTISAALVAAGLAPSAASAKTFTGESQQDRRVLLRTGDDGTVRFFRIDWKTRDCDVDDATLRDQTTFRAPFDSATPDAFADEGRYRAREGRRIRITTNVKLSGTRVVDPADPAAESWQGTFEASAVVRRRGKVIDRCTLSSTGWTATPRT